MTPFGRNVPLILFLMVKSGKTFGEVQGWLLELDDLLSQIKLD